MTLTNEAASWVEQTAGGKIVSSRLQGRWRPHIYIDLAKPDGEIEKLLLRYPRDPELEQQSAFLSHFPIEHEASVLAALQGSGLLVPRFYGFNPSLRAILMSCVAGDSNLAALSGKEQRQAMRDYIDQLAQLHQLKFDLRAIPACVVPTTPEELAFSNKFGFVEHDHRAVKHQLRPEPLLDFALAWLHENVPQRRTACCFVQGDTGPGQFMVDNGRVTALIDWELAHIGDPMIDLGVLRMRSMLYSSASINEHLRDYEVESGAPLDLDALKFYTVMSMLLSPLGMALSVQQPDAGISTMMARLAWDATLRRGLCEALCEAHGIMVEPPPLPQAGPASGLEGLLVRHLSDHCLPIARDDQDRYLLATAVGVARAIALKENVGRDIENHDLDDMALILGRRPACRADGLAELSEFQVTRNRSRDLDLLWLFSRMSYRYEFLMRPVMVSQMSNSLEPLRPNELTRYAAARS